ncbi:LmbE family N-acetylglucosaminyl deacetylase [Paenarthrobacter nicotinovorans]|uniref:PIG-L deacetylase family protein n=1 Tax=Paenarthrobacter nicotinovorans TaxID=29320 RepID=A0ABV0GNZ1_PAENI|nr:MULTISPECIES: PIG-L deacetylase family protein [Micrococcaceae]MDR6438030.1 LmbE family N-acetylglucosaminyl deacetylase [Paenarthrobacter nicotinovorans]SCZ62420.1 N-acetylglucosaminyl deacetylase, LmbE family [Arthrobacter sp. UNCCL28]
MEATLFAVAGLLGILVAGWALIPPGRSWFVRKFSSPHRLRWTLAGLGILLLAALAGCAVGRPHPSWLNTVVVVAGTALIFACLVAPAFRIPSRMAFQPRRVLAIGAHPDDLELACGATIAKLSDAGHDVRTMVMSTGSKGGDSSIRVIEAAAGSDFMGATAVHVHQFQDTNLSEHGQEMVKAIEKAIEDFHPDVVITHSRHDYHQDHQAVHSATMRAARRHSSILCFESPSSTRQFDPSVFVDIAGYVDVKIHAVGMHRNQKGKPYMSAERVRSLAAFRGSQVKTAYAEGFEPVRLLGSAVGEF